MRFDIWHHLDCAPSGRVDVNIGPPTRKRRLTVDLTCTVAQKIHIHFAPKTDSGRPATFDGTPTVTVATGDGTFEQDADGLGLYVISPDAPGDTSYLVEADGDLGSGVVTVQLAINLHATSENATNFGATADPAEAK